MGKHLPRVHAAPDGGAKAWSAVQVRAAFAGFCVWRSDPADGQVLYFAGRHGMVRVLATMSAVEQFLGAVGAPMAHEIRALPEANA